MDGLIISYLFFLAIPLYFLGIILRSAFPKFENDAISITLWILSVLICGFVGFEKRGKVFELLICIGKVENLCFISSQQSAE